MQESLKLDEIKGNIKNIQLLFLKKNTNFDSGYEPIKALIHKDIFNKIENLYIDSLDSLFKNAPLEEFSYDVSVDGAIQFLPISKLTHSSIFDIIINSIDNIKSLNTISNFEKTLSESYLYAFVFTLKNKKTFTLIRKVYSLNYLKNKGLLCFKDSRLNFLEEDLFALDSKVDCIIYNDNVYVICKYNFENIFSYNEHYNSKANEILSTIETSNILSNFEEFKTDCLDRSSIVKKLADLCVSGNINSFIKNIKNNPDNIQNTIKKYNLGITMKGNELLYTDISSLSEIINLISENYFEGDITSTKFLSRGKKQLPAKKTTPKSLKQKRKKKK